MFKAGAVVGEAILDASGWESGVESMKKSNKGIALAVATGTAAFELAKQALSAVVAQFGDVMQAGYDYQKSFANVTTITNASTAQFQQMSAQLIGMDAALGSTKDLTDALYQAISSGAAPGAESMDLVTQAAKFAKAGFTDTLTAVDVMTTAINSYGKANMSAEKTSNIFFKTTQFGKLTAEQLASSIGKSIPLYSSLKVPLEQLSAGMASMTLSGVSAEESTTQLNAVMNAFLKPSDAMSKKLEELGYKSGDAFIQANGLSGALTMLEDATGGSASELSKLVGDINGVRGVMALTGEGGKQFTNILNEMNKPANAVEEAFRRQANTLDIYKNTMGKTQIILGNVGNAFRDKMLGPITETLNKFNQFVMSAQGMEFFAQVAENLGAAFGTIKEFAQIIADQLGGPLFAAIDDIKNQFTAIFQDLKPQDGFKAIGIAAAVLSSALKIVLAVEKGIFTWFVNIIGVGKSFASVIGGIFDIITGKGSWAQVKENLGQTVDAVKNVYAGVANSAVDTFEVAWGEVKTFTDRVEDNGKRLAKSADTNSKAAGDAVKRNYAAWTTGMRIDTQEQTAIVAAAATAQTAVIVREKDAQIASYEQNKIDEARIRKELIAEAKTEHSEYYTWFSQMTSQTMSQAFQDFKQFYDYAAGMVSTFTTTAQNLMDAYYTNELDSLKTQRDNQEITEQQYRDKANAKAKEQFEATKKLKIATIWIDTASSIVKYWAEYGAIPVVGPGIAGAMSAAATALAVMNTAQIDRQKWVPAYEKGTDYAAGGMSLVGERGPELVNLPRGSQVLPAPVTEKALSGIGGGMTINIHNPVVRERQDIDRIIQAIEIRLGGKVRYA